MEFNIDSVTQRAISKYPERALDIVRSFEERKVKLFIFCKPSMHNLHIGRKFINSFQKEKTDTKAKGFFRIILFQTASLFCQNS